MVAERDEPTGALVRPYAVTRGRTRPKLDIALEALVETTVRGRNSVGRDGPQHGREQQYIASLCDGRLQSLAEVAARMRSEEHTSELQSQSNLVCRLLLEKKKNKHCDESILPTHVLVDMSCSLQAAAHDVDQ